MKSSWSGRTVRTLLAGLALSAQARGQDVVTPFPPLEDVQTVVSAPAEPFVAPPTADEDSLTLADRVRLDGGVVIPAGYFQGGGGAAGGGSKPKYPAIVISGAAQIDGIWFDQNAANRTVVGDAQDVAGFRRSRLGAKGNIAEDTTYKMEYDFGFPGRPNFTDVWVSQGNLPVLGNVKIGQWKQPFSMEPATSFRELMFMERSLAFALVPFRQLGIGAFNTAYDDSVTWAWSGYRFPTDVFGSFAGDGGYGMACRATGILLSDADENLIHIGGAYSYNNPTAGSFNNTTFPPNNPSSNAIRIRTTPEVGFTQLDYNNSVTGVAQPSLPIPFFLDSGPVAVNNYQIVGGEFAAAYGSMVFQSELMAGMFNRVDGGYNLMPAGYAQMGYVLTGERRKYDKKAAAFTRVIPDNPFRKGGGMGAWEIAGRYSQLDLNSLGVATSGRIQDLTGGLNWYLNQFTRLEFNYIHVILDRPNGNETHANIFGTRAQFDF